MFRNKSSDQADAAVALANVYGHIFRLTTTRPYAQWQRPEDGGLRKWKVNDVTVGGARHAYPVKVEELAAGAMKMAGELRDWAWESASSQANLNARLDKAEHDLGEARKRIASLEFEIGQARESLRDKLAACAMQPLLEAVTRDKPGIPPEAVHHLVAKEAYAQADAMLAERGGLPAVEVKP